MFKKVKRDDNYGYLNFFQINFSGLYRIQRGANKEIASKSFGLGTAEVFRAIKDWVRGRQFKETCSWSDIGRTGDDPVMCYCHEIKELDNGDFLLVLWKDDPSDKKGYRGLEIGADGRPTGRYLNNSASQTGDNYVWGHPCYYWVIPSEDLIVSIKFEDSKCDSDLMQKWVTNCVRYRLKLPGFNSRKAGESETKIFFSTPASPETYNLIYRFSARLKEFKTSEEHLKDICSRTKHMLLRNEVTVSAEAAAHEADRVFAEQGGLDKANIEVFDFIQTFLAKYFNRAESDGDSVRRVEIRLEATPDVDQLKELMEYSSDFPEDGWPDVIFIDENDVKTSIKKHRIVERIKLAKVVDAYSCDVIYGAIKDNRGYYLNVARQQAVSVDDGVDDSADAAESMG